MRILRSYGPITLALQTVRSRCLTESAAPAITIETINKSVIAAEYAVRGPIVNRAQVLEEEIRSNPGSLPFDEIVYCNIGNPQALGQKPITFFREVVALCDHSTLLDRPDVETLFSPAAVARARRIVSTLPSKASGAYSHSQGLRVCREAVAAGIEARDGYSSDPDHIFLTDGASSGVSQVMQLLISSPSDGVMCPIPQYPLYSATLTLLGGQLVKYYLDEAGGWGTNVKELESALQQAEAEGVRVKALVVINPGNPTGQVLNAGQQREIIQFCYDRNVALLADEVYQENVYAAHRQFTSFKKVACDMGLAPSALPLISFHSTSKGFYGECGRRGGYMEVCGLPPDVRDQLYKVASIGLCSNVGGQVLMSCVMDPPEDGEGGALFSEERDAILSSLGRRAEYMVARLNELEGVTCNPSEGAMYAFPRINLPRKAEEAAAAAGVPPDTFYAQQLLEETGIVVVPGTGFGQVAGTWHIRLTILPSEEVMPRMMERLAAFHHKFMDTHRG